jgi:hypothetical protein
MKTIDWKNATPEQINFWNITSAKLAFTTITPIYYLGACAGSEFETYDAAKLYIALEFGILDSGLNTNWGFVQLYNEANAASAKLTNNVIAYGIAYNYLKNSLFVQNVYFGRIAVTEYLSIKFNGYRLHT